MYNLGLCYEALIIAFRNEIITTLKEDNNMAIYGTNRCASVAAENVEADLSYGWNDAGRMLTEAKENDAILFAGIITNDIESAITEDAEYRAALTEGTVANIWNSITTVIEKLIAKIKGLFNSFLTKIQSFVMDSQKFYKQYAPKVKKMGSMTKNVKKFNVAAYSSCGAIENVSLEELVSGGSEGVKKVFPKAIAAEIGEEITDASIREAFTKACFEEAKEISLTGAEICDADWIGGLISSNSSKAIADMKKANKATETALGKQLSEAKKKAKAGGKTKSEDKVEESFVLTEADEAEAGNAVDIMRKYQTAIISYNRARLGTLVEALKQANQIFKSAAASGATASDTNKAKQTAKAEGFDFVGPEYDGLVDVFGEEAAVEEAAFMAECEVDMIFAD